MLPFILISLIPAISVFSIWARSTMSAPIVALLYVSYTVWLLFRAFLSFLMFHDSLAHWFWDFVSSIFVLILHSLTVPIITRIGCLFYVSIWVDLSFIISRAIRITPEHEPWAMRFCVRFCVVWGAWSRVYYLISTFSEPCYNSTPKKSHQPQKVTLSLQKVKKVKKSQKK